MNRVDYRRQSSLERAEKNNTNCIGRAFRNRRNPILRREHRNKMDFLRSIHLEIADKIETNQRIFAKYEAKPENTVEVVRVREANRRKTDFVKRPQNGDFYACHTGFAELDSSKGELKFAKEVRDTEINNPDYLG